MAALGLVAAASACGEVADLPGASDAASDAGSGDADPVCPVAMCAPYACAPRGGRCLTVCRELAQCAPGFVCESGFCVGTDCTEETAATRCGGYACVRGTCRRDCNLGPCTEGFYCRGDTGQCIRKCTASDDPVCGGYLCDVGSQECEPYCLDGELACAPGYACTRAMTCERDGG